MGLTVFNGAVLGDRKSLRLPLEGLKFDGRSGLVFVDGPGEGPGEKSERSWSGRGDSGTFHKLASSGRSSSESLYSSSNSLMDFRLSCHDPRLIGGFLTTEGTRGP